MKYDQYITLIQSLEAYAAKSPGGYEFRVFLLTVLGYAYFIGIMLLLLAPLPVILFLFWLAPTKVLNLLFWTAKLWWVLIPGLGVFFGFLGSAARSITARVPEPEGRELSRDDAPALFDFVAQTAASLDAGMPKRVLLTDAFNASVMTLPRLGIFGRKTYLMLGLPVMKALTAEQFKAVLAHEMGHVSGKHGRFSKWAYQMEEAWGRLISSQEAVEHKFAALYKNFVDWFFPYFRAYSFVLNRRHEKDADADAVQLVGARALGEALILLETKNAELEQVFWKGVHEENIAAETPTDQMFTRMLGALAFVDNDRAATTLARAIAVPTDYGDTHPSLGDRLKLMGYWTGEGLPDLPDAVATDAAKTFLVGSIDAFTVDFDSSWDEQAAREWKARHDHFRESQKRVAELEEKERAEDVTSDEMLEMSARLAEKEGNAATLPILERASEKFPESAAVLYSLGGVRLGLDDERGLNDLRRSVELDPTYKLAADEIIFQYLRLKGRLDEAKSYAASVEAEYDIIAKAQKERSAVFPEDKFEIHHLTDEFLEKIPQKLGTFEEITAVYAVRKVVKYKPEIPFHVLFIELRKKGPLKNRGDLAPADIINIVVERLDTGEINFFATLTAQFAGTKYYLDKIDGSRVYKRAAG